MFSFLSFLFKSKNKSTDLEANFASIWSDLKNLYDFKSISPERKKILKKLIDKNGYLPYSHIKALEELSNAEVLLCLELILKNNKIYKDDKFTFTSTSRYPAYRAGFSNSDWLKKEQHNIKLINLAALADGNLSDDTGKFMDWLKQVIILPSGIPEKGVLATTIYLVPFHPREFGCAYLPTASDVSQNIEDKFLSDNLNLDVNEQVKLFILIAQLAGHSVIYDILPQTCRYSKIVLANPQIARWFDINELIEKYKQLVDNVADKLKTKYDADDIDVITKIFKSNLSSGSEDLSEFYKTIYNEFEIALADQKKELSEKMLLKDSQANLLPKIKDVIAKTNNKKSNAKLSESDITNQGLTIQKLIDKGFWPAPGGAWCSCGVPVFNKMDECGGYPTFKHYDVKGNDVTEFANLDCQTPFYFVYLENGLFNKNVVDFFVKYMVKLQADFKFDGFRIDHIDHVVDYISEKNGIPISYRAPRAVLAKLNSTMKSKIKHFAILAEYMLWDNFYKEYHQDMNFDLLWGNDIISQMDKNPANIIADNQYLENYNSDLPQKFKPLSVLKTYNNQDGEFKAIFQYPGQLSEEGALFKWFKFKFLPGGKLAQRPVMYVDGDESFTQTGLESVIGAEISLKRAKNYAFYEKFTAINKFALNNELTREGEAEILTQDDDGFVSWLVSKDPLKTSLLIVANYQAPTEMVRNECGDFVEKRGISIEDKVVNLPCDYKILSQIIYDSAKKEFVELPHDPVSKLDFSEIMPSEFFIYKVTR